MSAFNLGVFILCALALIEEGSKVKVVIIFTAIYGFATFFMVFFTFLTTIKDPTDPTVKLERSFNADLPAGKDFIKNNYNFYCDLCDTHVLANTKHCRTCNRCTAGFDHHCQWVNNDIGSANYLHFILSLVFLLCVLVIQIATIGLSLFQRRRVKREEILLTRRAVAVVLWVNLVEVVFFFMQALFLILFHAYLKLLNMTTFEHIRKKQNRSTESRNIKRVQHEETTTE